MGVITWSDVLKPRRRQPYLYFYKDGVFVPFKGQSIPKVCRVLSAEYRQAGVWSGSTYVIEHDTWSPFQYIRPWNGWSVGFDQLRKAIELFPDSPIQVDDSFLRSLYEYSKRANRNINFVKYYELTLESISTELE